MYTHPFEDAFTNVYTNYQIFMNFYSYASVYKCIYVKNTHLYI